MQFKKVNRVTTPDFQQWWFDTWSRKILRSISLLVRGKLEKPASGAAAAWCKSEGKGKINSGETAYNGQQKVKTLEEMSVV